MSTWHQQRNPVQLWHPIKWSSYNPKGHLSIMRHESAEACLMYCNKTGDIPLSPHDTPPRASPAKPKV